MITGPLKQQIDTLWNQFYNRGFNNSLRVIEQITYLLFARRLDDMQTSAESMDNLLGAPAPGQKRTFGPKDNDLRWSRFKQMDPREMHVTVRDKVFPFIKALGAPGSAYERFMRGAQFEINDPNLLDIAVKLIDQIPMQDRDTKGDIYEYMLSHLQTEGRSGQFRTPRHIIRTMVEMAAPTPHDVIADPACGTCGFLVTAGEYLREHHSGLFSDKKQREHFDRAMFHGIDTDDTMLRIGTMNMLLHGVDHPDIIPGNALSSEANPARGAFTLILANPPFAGAHDAEEVARDLKRLTNTSKTELLFVSLFLNQLQPGGRCCCIVPAGVLFGASKAHKDLRKALVDDQRLDAVITLPSGVFKPYAGVATAFLLFTRTDSGGTDQRGVFFYDVQADGFSLDDKRDPIDANDLPDVVKQWQASSSAKAAADPLKGASRAGKCFRVPAAEVRKNDYDLSINRYKQVTYEAVEYDPPKVILSRLAKLEAEIVKGQQELEGMLK